MQSRAWGCNLHLVLCRGFVGVYRVGKENGNYNLGFGARDIIPLVLLTSRYRWLYTDNEGISRASLLWSHSYELGLGGHDHNFCALAICGQILGSNDNGGLGFRALGVQGSRALGFRVPSCCMDCTRLSYNFRPPLNPKPRLVGWNSEHFH